MWTDRFTPYKHGEPIKYQDETCTSARPHTHYTPTTHLYLCLYLRSASHPLHTHYTPTTHPLHTHALHTHYTPTTHPQRLDHLPLTTYHLPLTTLCASDDPCAFDSVYY